VHFVSTAFVQTIERGTLGDLSPDNVVIPYITSKFEAERVVAESGIPHSIYRSTNLVGDSRTGASSAPQILQRLSTWVCRGKAPYFPAYPGNLIDVVPLDVIAIAIARAVETDDLGRLYWLTYGPHAMTVEETLEIAVEHARSRGRDIVAPPVVDPDEPLPIPLEQIPPRSRRYVKLLLHMNEGIRSSGGVLPTSIDELRTRLGVPMPSDRDAYRASLEYWTDEARAARDASEVAEAA
jgi:nucleoside-diphosphate-sugar epimerase